MISRTTPLAFAAATLVAWALVLGILVDRAELFVAAIPLAAALLSAGPRTRAPRLELRQELSAIVPGSGRAVVAGLGAVIALAGALYGGSVRRQA